MQRLVSRRQFQAVLAGVTVARTAHFAMHRTWLQTCVAPDNGDANANKTPVVLFGVAVLWLGAMVPKRWAKRAVTRNTIKRQVFEVSKDFQPRMPVAAYLVRLRCGFDRQRFKSASSEALKRAIQLELRQLFDKACLA